MDLPDSDPSAALCREILAEARRRGQEIVGQAVQQAEALVATADAESRNARQRRLEQAGAEAAHRTEALRATVGVEADRMRAAHLEALLDALYQDARRRLVAGEGYDDRQMLLALSSQAIERMEGDSFLLLLAPGTPVTAADIRRAAGRASLDLTLREDPTIAGHGVIIQDTEGRQVWDNRLPARLDRLWPEMRGQVVQRLTGGA